MNPSPLLTLPKELFLFLLSHFERRRDLVSLALTSKVIYRIVVPLFIDVVHIRCDPRRVDLWQWLVSKPHLAATIRTLELYNEEDHYQNGIVFRPIIPSFLPYFALEYPGAYWQETLEKSVLSLTAAVMLMKGLRRFRWCTSLRPVPPIELLFNSLEKLNDIDELYLGSNGISSTCDYEPMSAKVYSPLANFHNITTFCLEGCFTSKWHDGKLGRLIPHWIIQLKQLNILYLMFMDDDPLDLSVICDHAHWPCLVELSLKGVMTFYSDFQDINNEEHDAESRTRLGNFIRGHPTLQRLKLQSSNIDWSELFQLQTVSQLRSLIWYDNHSIDPHLNHWSPDDQLPEDNPQELQYLECFISMKSIPAIRTMTSLRALYAVEIDIGTFEHLVEVAPQIQQLYIPCRRWYPGRGVKNSDTCCMDDRVVSSLFKLKRLIQLEGLITMYGYTTYINENILNRLIHHGRLLYIDSWRLGLIVEHLRAGKGNIDGPLRDFMGTVAIPNIQKSAGFCTDSPTTPLTVK